MSTEACQHSMAVATKWNGPGRLRALSWLLPPPPPSHWHMSPAARLAPAERWAAAPSQLALHSTRDNTRAECLLRATCVEPVTCPNASSRACASCVHRCWGCSNTWPYRWGPSKHIGCARRCTCSPHNKQGRCYLSAGHCSAVGANMLSKHEPDPHMGQRLVPLPTISCW